MSDVSQADLAIIAKTPILRTDIAIESVGGGGCPPGESCLPDTYIDPADCPGCDPGSECLPSTYIDPADCPSCDYQPYCLSQNATDADTLILALAPFAYYVADDASGNPQDSSGNGNHAAGTVATIAYNQGALTSKATDSIAITAGGKIQFPTPAGTLMRDLGAGSPNPWAITGLIQFTARDGGDGGTERAWLSQLGSTGINFVCAFPQVGNGTVDLTNLLIGSFWRMGGDPSIPLNQPHVFCLMREGGQVGIWGRDIVKWYVNGVCFGQCPIGDGSSTGENFFLGRPSDEFWGAPDLLWSNLAVFDRALTPAEVVSIAEVLLDTADLAAGWTP